ncbi:hypothetical protein CGMCC3_g17401 [Colletotrichum fructicola]|nr:uncharacterized protein CGMCC3_g17401 [Colletotrichum fructicola]KAE9566439.1 hypothetical protein CGMCC3_g17401 [Colletotrichum fructicola]
MGVSIAKWTFGSDRKRGVHQQDFKVNGRTCNQTLINVTSGAITLPQIPMMKLVSAVTGRLFGQRRKKKAWDMVIFTAPAAAGSGASNH